jgi:hypothetical protein
MPNCHRLSLRWLGRGGRRDRRNDLPEDFTKVQTTIDEPTVLAQLQIEKAIDSVIVIRNTLEKRTKKETRCRPSQRNVACLNEVRGAERLPETGLDFVLWARGVDDLQQKQQALEGLETLDVLAIPHPEDLADRPRDQFHRLLEPFNTENSHRESEVVNEVPRRQRHRKNSREMSKSVNLRKTIITLQRAAIRTHNVTWTLQLDRITRQELIRCLGNARLL